MMKRLLFFLIINLLLGNLFAQNFEFRFGVNYSSFNMKETKEFSSFILKTDGFPTRQQDVFPSTFNFSGEAAYHFNSFFVGMRYSKLSTYCRNSYSDYSGHVYVDFLSDANLIGPYIGINNADNKKIFQVRPSIYFPLLISNFEIESQIKIYEEVDSESLLVESTSIGIQPSLDFYFQIKTVSISLNLGYLFDTKGHLHEPGNIDMKLVNNENNEIRTNWSGFKVELLLGIKI
jgi:hypothetical protein